MKALFIFYKFSCALLSRDPWLKRLVLPFVIYLSDFGFILFADLMPKRLAMIAPEKFRYRLLTDSVLFDMQAFMDD